MEEDEFLRNKYNQEARDKMDESDFAGPHQSFPIKDQEDVDNAARLIGHADDPEAVKRKIISIAKKKGLELPKSWQEEEDGKGSEERMEGKQDETIERVADGQPTDISFYAPFIRVDDKSDKREVVGKATRGTPIDTYGTVITYDGSKKAFARAGRIPLREMHQPKAVGKGLEWWGDDTSEDIYLHSYISRGAEDTWTKVQEDVLVGYSIKGKNAKYGTIQRDGKAVPAIVDYDLVEVSLVDNPSCPGCDIAIMRGDGIEGVIASDEEMAELSQKEQPAPEVTPVVQPSEIERAGARLSNDTQAAMHKSIGHTLEAAKSQMQNCGCDTCQAVIAMLDPDNDGDIDLGGYDDPDGDGGMAPSSDDDMEERVERMVSSSVTSSMSAVYTRMQAMLGEFARRQTENTTVSSAIERMQGTLAQTANKAEIDAKMDKVLTELESVKGLFERIAQTPVPGGPHTGRMAQKHLSTDGAASPSAETPDILRQINNAGVTLTPQQQALLVAGSLKPLS